MATVKDEPMELIPNYPVESYHQLHPELPWDAMAFLPDERKLRIRVNNDYAWYYILSFKHAVLQWLPVNNVKAPEKLLSSLTTANLRERVSADMAMRNRLNSYLKKPKEKKDKKVESKDAED